MDRLGEYLVRRLVGEGGMGKVYEAEERLSHRRVALKVLRQELARSEEGRRLFLNEMTILAHLDHPNVVRCLSCSEVDDQLVMALEFLEGRTLRDQLDRGRTPRLDLGRGHRGADRLGAGGGAAAGPADRAPRSEARERDDPAGRRREGDGLRYRQGAAGAGAHHDAERGHAVVHEPGADRRRQRGWALGSVLPGSRALRDAGGQSRRSSRPRRGSF